MAETTTIAALATAPAPAGVAVIRVSGPKSRAVLKSIFRSKLKPGLHPRTLIFGQVIDFQTQDPVDKALAVFMPAPHSYTGEDVAEFHCHGSQLLVQKVLRSLYAFGVLPAEPGEFTKRAFLNGKMDLVQAEAVADLINATSEHAYRIAEEQLEGRFSHAINKLGEPLRNALAEITATIDFPEEDIEPDKLSSISAVLEKSQDEITALLKSYSYGQVVKDGFRVLLCGRPNVGKSSLLNILLGRERAIVTEVSGTTRDLLEEEAILGGYRFLFCDSAGIAPTADKVERIGIELARNKINWADLVILVADATDKERDYEKVLEEVRGKAKKIWMVTNKMDLNPNAISTVFCDSRTCAQNFYVSAKTRDGVDSLTQALVDEINVRLTSETESSNVVTNERHRSGLSKAFDSLGRAIDACKKDLPLEIIAAELHICLNALEEILGKTSTEDILGRIFSKFCVGK